MAKLTSEILPGSTLIHEDDFFKHDDEVPFDEKYQIHNWDSPEALDLDLFGKELVHIKKTGTISAELIHNNNMGDLSELNVNQATLKEISAKYSATFGDGDIKVVLVDGFMIYNNQDLASRFDVKLLIRAPRATLKKRRAARSGYKTLDSFWVDPPFYFDEFVYKAYAENHACLFENGDVEGALKKDVDIYDFINDDNTDINEALMWICDHIISMR